MSKSNALLLSLQPGQKLQTGNFFCSGYEKLSIAWDRRKNYLFCKNHDAAENAAIMYSLLGCCKASDVNPREWLTDVLTQIPRYNSDYSLDLADLLPHNWKGSNLPYS